MTLVAIIDDHELILLLDFRILINKVKGLIYICWQLLLR